jgi:tetratricopeptide (TPR) repeat protein
VERRVGGWRETDRLVNRTALDAAPVEWIFFAGGTPPAELAAWLTDTLPSCAWTCHVVIVSDDPEGRLLDAVVDHLGREQLATVHLHRVFTDWLNEESKVARLMAAATSFQTEAYRERTGSRLVPLPILDVPAGTDPRSALGAAGELAGRLAKPSLLLSDPPAESVALEAAALGLRLYLGLDDDQSSTMEILTSNHVLDSTLERFANQGMLLDPCRAHLVVADGRVFGCARQWQRGLSQGGTADVSPPSWAPDTDLCPGCIADAVARLGPSLAANLRQADGRELALRISATLVDDGEPGAAAELAGTAAELSATDSHMVDALVQTALCRLADGRFDAADRALKEAAAHGAPAGSIAYHRARVQVAWRDDIVALDLFDDALTKGTDAVSEEDLHFEMALSHIRLEEWANARSHLQLAGGPKPEISFNLGVCDVNDRRAERALGHFDDALALAPAADDLGRVHFFRGFCLKELERYDEAVFDLERSLDLEQAESEHHNLLGFCLFKLGRHVEAVTSFEHAVALDPSSAIDWANIGVNLERLGETDRAEEMYRKALGMDPSIAFAKEGLERLVDSGE